METNLDYRVRTLPLLIAGALYIEDFKRICNKVGFSDPRQLSISEIEVHDPELKAITGNIKFYSILYRCFKIKSLETLCEDYGQVAYVQYQRDAS